MAFTSFCCHFVMDSKCKVSACSMKSLTNCSNYSTPTTSRTSPPPPICSPPEPTYSIYHYHIQVLCCKGEMGVVYTEAVFLDVIGTKVVKSFPPCCSQSPLSTYRFYPPTPPRGRAQHDFILAWLEAAWYCSESGQARLEIGQFKKGFVKCVLLYYPGTEF